MQGNRSSGQHYQSSKQGNAGKGTDLLLSRDKLKDWMTNGYNMSDVKALRKNVEEHLKGLSQRKVRKFYQQVVRLVARLTYEKDLHKIYKDIAFVYALSSYEKGREPKNKQLQIFLNTISQAIEKLTELVDLDEISDDSPNNLKDIKEQKRYIVNFISLLEFIVAFHREFNPK